VNRRDFGKSLAVALGGSSLVCALVRTGLAATVAPDGTESENARFFVELIKRIESSGMPLPAVGNLAARYQALWDRTALDDTWDAVPYMEYAQTMRALVKASESDAAAARRCSALLHLLEQGEALLGKVKLEGPCEFTAGGYGSAHLRYIPGALPLLAGDRVICIFPHIESDWGALQSKNSKAPNYMSVQVSGGSVQIVEDWLHSAIEGRLYETHLRIVQPGSIYQWVLGDTVQGSPGWRTQSFGTEFGFSVLLSLGGSAVYLPVQRLMLKVRPAEAHELRVVLPSLLPANESFKVSVQAIDIFGNPTLFNGELQTCWQVSGNEAPEEAARLEFALHDRHREARCPGRGVGIHRLRVDSTDGKLHGLSNPLVIRPEVRERIYWGDTHTHSWYSDGMGRLENSADYARHVSLLDYLAATDHAEGLTDREWNEIQHHVAQLNDPDHFACLLGFEWTQGNSAQGGHHNFCFREGQGPRIGSCVYEHAAAPDISPAEPDIHRAIKAIAATGRRFMVIPHAHCPGNWADHFPKAVRNVEIHSVHASFEWFGRYFLESGNKVGFLGSSDSHTGTPGDLTAATGVRVRGGLAPVFTCGLKRENIWDALWNRHCYATSGARIFLDLSADGSPMGAEMSKTRIDRIKCQVAGTGPLHKVELIRTGGKVWKSFDLAGAEADQRTTRYRLYFHSSTEPQSPRNVDYRLPEKGWGTIRIKVIGNRSRAFVPFNNHKRSFEVVQQDESRMEFTLVTRGDESGFLLETEQADVGEVRFEHEQQVYVVPLAQNRDAHFEVGLGRFGLQRLKPLPPCDFFRTIDDFITEHDEEYFYLKVLQVDGAQAWSSPIFVHRGSMPKPGGGFSS
jgi:hypothetical protein